MRRARRWTTEAITHTGAKTRQAMNNSTTIAIFLLPVGGVCAIVRSSLVRKG